MASLTGKAAVVTGAASGIGRATAIRFAEEGASVCLIDADEGGATGVASEIHGKFGNAYATACDVSDADAVKAAIDGAAERFGRLDIVYANAGINGVWAPIEELQPDEWDKTIAVNLRGTYLTLHFAIPHLRTSGGGSVIVTSSVNGNRTFSNAGASAYSTSKAGQIAFMKMAALELGRYNIRVNAVCPGAIHTNIEESTKKRDIEEVEIKVEMPAGAPFIHGGQGEAADVADVCVFLASDMSRHVSGVEIYVDGGASLLR